jgi:hypothetical protein
MILKPEQVKALAELAGKHAAEKFTLDYSLNSAATELADKQREESRELATKLGILPLTPPPAAASSVPTENPNFPPGLKPGMTVADIPPEWMGAPPEAGPGQVVPIAPPPPPVVPPGATNIPRPLKDRK